jgi:benzoyl-CoA 2,3-dioxygenase component A
VQDLLRERAADVLELLKDENTFVYVCGLKSMEDGVVAALRDAAEQGGVAWEALAAKLEREGRLHVETY